MQAQIEGTKYELGTTMTAMAMRKALALFIQNQRKDKDTAKVCVVFCHRVGPSIRRSVRHTFLFFFCSYEQFKGK